MWRFTAQLPPKTLQACRKTDFDRLLAAGCFGRGIYVAQNSLVAFVHTHEDFESAGHFVAMKSKNNQPPPVLHFVVCFAKMRNYDKFHFPPKPVMEMIYNGFPSTAETLSSRDVVIGNMPLRFSEAVVLNPNRAYTAWHVQVQLVPGLSGQLPCCNRAFNDGPRIGIINTLTTPWASSVFPTENLRHVGFIPTY